MTLNNKVSILFADGKVFGKVLINVIHLIKFGLKGYTTRPLNWACWNLLGLLYWALKVFQQFR